QSSGNRAVQEDRAIARTPGRTCPSKCEASRPTAHVDAARSALAIISPPFRMPSMPPSATELKHSSVVTTIYRRLVARQDRCCAAADLIWSEVVLRGTNTPHWVAAQHRGHW